MIDIDHFKRINDLYGHDIGDIVLKGVTKVMTDELREMDVFGRWGGEEFLCILPSTDVRDAQLCAERLRKTLSTIDFSEASTSFTATASFGVATSHPSDNTKSIVKRCDVALYKAKAEGRNRVVTQLVN